MHAKTTKAGTRKVGFWDRNWFLIFHFLKAFKNLDFLSVVRGEVRGEVRGLTTESDKCS